MFLPRKQISQCYKNCCFKLKLFQLIMISTVFQYFQYNQENHQQKTPIAG